MKNIIFVTNYFGNGGAATVMKTLIDKFPDDQYRIKLVSFLDDKKKYEIPAKVEYIKLSHSMTLNILEKLRAIRRLRQVLKQEQNSAIVSFEYFINMRTIIANIALKNKLIISERNDPSKSGNRKKKLRNFLYKFADILVCQTNDAKKYFPKSIRKKTVVIPNPIMDGLPERYDGIRNKEIVTFCRITKQKNLPMLIDAFEKVHLVYSDYKLKIYGDGLEKANILKYVEDKNLNDCVELFPFKKNIHGEILKAKMFVSSSDFEGISNSMIEAMGIGLPTICTDCPCGGANMMINDHENGILVPVNDVNSLFDAMLEIIIDEKLANTLSRNAVLIKNRLNARLIVKQWLDIINE